MEPVIEKDFNIQVGRAEVLRLLGAAEGTGTEGSVRLHRTGAGGNARRPGSQSGGRVEQALESCLESAAGLLRPAGIYVIAAGSALPGSDMFTDLERVAFCVCTIGPALEREVTRLGDNDDLLAAFVLDAVGSVAAEAAADYMDGRIQAEAAREGLRTSCRASPGYGDWDIREQASIFRLVPAERIGVKLTGGMMMVPRKSVSFAIHIDEKPVRMRSENSCGNCDRTDCPFRLLE
ncbi:MAG TPA: vitamin B12 dependent-methionine synthase activation domain-containing protein [Patescibacteria group bacterium]|nr:vitamin B12 dependent-methionine synthase activation domain-containing protein [Patescibacteria group bacterium]